MLNHISIWQMVIDVCLMTSILVMAFRYAKGGKAQVLLPRLVELEGRISVLMAETEGRAQHISDQLLRREHNLSKQITDLGKREQDVGTTIATGEALAKELALLCESARREAADLERIVVEARAVREAQQPTRTAEPRREYEQLRNARSDQSAPQVAEPQRFTTRGDSRRASEWLDDVADRGEQKENAKSARSSVRSLQDSYKTAEEMLKQGRDAEEVSERTSLPIEGVQRLAQMIEIEREERVDLAARYQVGRKSADPRLGALGVSRRSTPTA